MRLVEALSLKPTEARTILFRLLSEAPSGAPRWQFQYGGAKHDPAPDTLMLGSYQHPGSNNELVGGINLNYLSPPQLQQLQQALPQIMRGGDLKQRHNIGADLLPDIFNNFYRTYRSDLISGISPSELPYWITPKGRASLSAKTARQKDTERRTNQAHQQQLRKQALAQVQPPEQPQVPVTAAPRPPTPAQLATQQQAGQQELQRLAAQQQARTQQLAAIKQRTDRQKAKQDAVRNLERERQQNLQQLSEPEQDGAELGDPLAVESITYWSPVRRRYITERIRL